MTNDYQFRLKPPLKPEDVVRLRIAVGWDAATELYQQVLCKTYLWIGCFISEELVGYVDVVSDGVADAYIRDLIVHPRHQRRGIGTKLVSMVIDQVRQDGIRMVSVVFDPQLTAFYRGLGFHIGASGLIDFGAKRHDE
jgi:ribosomal protein S18 acetylase RimI-like enzyme